MLDIKILTSKNDETGKGGGGIRTHVGVTQDGFQDRCLKPLGHATA